MQIKKTFFLILFILLFFASKTSANTNIHLKINTNNSVIYDNNISVSPCDSERNGIQKTTAYCAILQSGIPNTWDWSWAPGAFLTSLNNIAGYTSKDGAGNDVYHYWSWYLNSVEAMIALNQYELNTNDLITISFIEPNNNSNPSGGEPVLKNPQPKNKFNREKALNFIISEQKDNGSFSEEIYTDWSSIALATSNNHSIQIEKLRNYYLNNKLKGNLLTDYERRAMALYSLGLNPYSINEENYIKKILESFDGTQFGDEKEDNDDIFALLILQKANIENKKILDKTIDFIISKQKENGSWDNNPDMTGAGILSIAFKKDNQKVIESLTKAKKYLQKTQNTDGGWGNVSSTSWAIQGILGLGEKIKDWTKIDLEESANNPIDYLGNKQETNGGMKNSYSIWETSYAIVATSEKSWLEIMKDFKENIKEDKTSLKDKNTISQTKNTAHEKYFVKNIDNDEPTLIEQSPAQTNQPVTKENWLNKIINKLLQIF